MPAQNSEVESRYAWLRLATSFTLLTIGGVGMYAVIVAMPVIESTTLTKINLVTLKSY